MKQQQAGFTLIELVVVIVILGILAATALPRFAGFQTDARKSAVNGMLAAVQGASALAHATALVQGQTGATGAISMEGQNINLVNGWPAAALAGGIENAVTYSTGANGFSYTAGAPATFQLMDSANAAVHATGCQVSYTASAAANTPPTIAAVITNC